MELNSGLKNKQFLERVRSYQDQETFQACEFAILQSGKPEEFFFAGASKVSAGMSWDLASVSKVLGVGTVLVNRVLSGKINLDAALQSYYPAWHEPTVTVRQLLTHTSGINPFIVKRDKLDFSGLVTAMSQLEVTSDKSFRYTDVNFILLGLMLEQLDNCSLDHILQKEVFDGWKMTKTRFGPVDNAIATVKDQPAGIVHDPKARVLGVHCGSAGLFSTLSDLTKFVQGYFMDEKYLQLLSNYARTGNKPRSLAWDLLDDDYLLHTGYTGTFILMNLRTKKGVIFLSNRVYYRDERQKWITDRDLLIKDFQDFFS